jgi:arginyl-tRNA synthetase
VREEIQGILLRAAERVVREVDAAQLGELRALQLGSPKLPEHGDFSSNAALVLAGPLKMSPREVADRILRAIEDPEGLLDRIEVAGPGFVNLFLAQTRWHEVLTQVLRDGEQYGSSDAGAGEPTLVEFVSANPTGPLTIGHGRNAVLGDCIARILEATGSKVTREYYFNDAGRQMRILAESLRSRYRQELGDSAELPEEGYQGSYLVETAKELVREHGDSLREAEWSVFKQAAEKAIFADIRSTLDRLGVRFDVFFNENSLYEGGLVERALEDLRSAGRVYEKDGAVWLRLTDAAFERDRVLVKSSGEPTYLLPDIAYHREKLRRGFQRLVDVLGADHIEQFPYVRAATAHLGFDPDRIEAVYYQWVNLRRGSEVVKMSTRSGSFVTVDEVLDEVGVDVLRYFMVDRRADTHLDFDLALAHERSERNPVYKIQYAHARLCSIERLAVERGATFPLPEDVPAERLSLPEEIELIKSVGRFPEIVLRAARTREPYDVARYLLDLATEFHTYISDGRRHRVLADDPELQAARLALVRGIRIVLANGLGLLRIQAPERM